MKNSGMILLDEAYLYLESVSNLIFTSLILN